MVGNGESQSALLHLMANKNSMLRPLRFQDGEKFEHFSMGRVAASGRPKMLLEKIRVQPDAISTLDQNGKSPLMWATSSGQLESADIILEAGADINHIGGEGKTALAAAYFKEDENMVKFLIEKGAFSNIRPLRSLNAKMRRPARQFITLVHLAYLKGGRMNNTLFSMLVEAIAGDLNGTAAEKSSIVEASCHRILLEWACAKSDYDTAGAILLRMAQGALSTNNTDNSNSTFPTTPDKQGTLPSYFEEASLYQAPFHPYPPSTRWVVQTGHWPLVNTLLKHSSSSVPAVFCAAIENRQDGIIAKLLENENNKEILTHADSLSYKEVYDSVINLGDVKTLQLLLENELFFPQLQCSWAQATSSLSLGPGPLPLARLPKDWPLFSAAQQGSALCLRPLLATQLLCPCAMAQDAALHMASEHGHPEAVRLLLRNGANPSRREDRRGRTALHAVAAGLEARAGGSLPTGCVPRVVATARGDGAAATAALLVDAGADPATRDATGATPLQLLPQWVRTRAEPPGNVKRESIVEVLCSESGGQKGSKSSSHSSLGSFECFVQSRSQAEEEAEQGKTAARQRYGPHCPADRKELKRQRMGLRLGDFTCSKKEVKLVGR